jgi:hypothetical protein
MPANPLDSKFPLRMLANERDTIEAIQTDAANAGITASLNDVIRHLIRRSRFELRPPATEPDARAVIMAHWKVCPDCDPKENPRCLDGLYLQRGYQRVIGQETRARTDAARAAREHRFQPAP